MIIGVDGNEANVQHRVGIGEYAFELLKQFYESQKPPIRQAQGKQVKSQNDKLKFKIYLKYPPLDELPKPQDWWEYRVIGPNKLWTQIALPIDLFLRSPRPDVFFSPTHYAPRFSPIPTVISIMDLSYIYYPEMFKRSDLYQLVHWSSYSIKKASRIIAISKSTKNDIIKHYKQSLRAYALKVSGDKVMVVYPGIKVKSQKLKVKSTMQNSKILKEKYSIEGEYILFVGTLQPRKNIVRLIEAFARVIRGPASGFPPASARSSLTSSNELRAVGSPSTRVTPQLKLIIVGKKGWMYEEILRAPEKFGVADSVKFLDFVPDEDLSTFYQNAVCFVLPSLYEGFGLPVLEAMKYGCPVLSSNVSSLPEAGGDAALYFNPLNVDDIAEKIEQVLKNNTLRQKMKEKGFNQVKKFSWEKAARETLEVLREVAR